MRFHHRIRTIYCKELVDILRDRRTLIAMIVVPIVLYPLLMLGSIQAVSYQMESVGEEPLIAGVIGERQGVTLHRLIEMDKRALAQTRARLDPESAEFNDLPTPIDNTGIRAFASREHLVKAVRRRVVRLGVIFEGDVWIRNFERTNEVEFLSDREDLRSSLALQRIEEMFERLKEQAVHQRKQALGLPDTFDKPFALTVTDLSTPSSLLGQILPLILILMTITGAIYPAIDLTAGERERGTLESLMVCPVPIIDLIVGKFLVVATVAIMGAALNLASVSATFWFGGFNKMIAGGGGIPVSTMGLILLCLIPFAVLMSAIMIAVCSYARTFKEAQNYVTPVILAVLIPGGIAALPATRFEGVMLVMPVGNMVLLTRELLLDTAISFGQVGMVLISTTLYAGAAVAVAAGVFGKESVIFADAGSLRSTLARKLIKPSAHPTVSMGLLVTALLFPAWFYVQASLSPDADATTAVGVLYGTGRLMPIFFILVPVGILVYFKVNIRNTFALRMPTGRHLLAGVLIGVSAFVPARELSIVQRYLIGIPEIVQKNAEMLGQTLASLPLTHALLLVAVVPAICEELLFRGFLLGALRNTNSSHSVRKWSAILVSAAVFGVFHFFVFKFPVTAALGAVLGYLCWQSRSILPVIIAHMLHNGIGTLSAIRPTWFDWMTTPNADEWAHL
ncbi:MAG: CPBP family intramembrane metalloprotease, partial [Planctomycetes bacterium]|nr:CPBP family intramembrane metalloprotease [Planctomycetota bacterium]